MTAPDIDLSINVIAQNEGLLLYKSLRAIDAARKNAFEAGYTTELNVFMINADNPTHEAYKVFISQAYVRQNTSLISDTYKVSEAKKEALKQSNGKYVSFYSPMDLLTPNYIIDSLRFFDSNRTVNALFVRHTIEFYGAHQLNVLPKAPQLSSNLSVFFNAESGIPPAIVNRAGVDILAASFRDRNDDYSDWNRLVLLKNKKVVFIPNTMYFKRVIPMKCNEKEVLLDDNDFYSPTNFIDLPVLNTTVPEVKKNINQRHAVLKRYPQIHKYLSKQYGIHKEVYQQSKQEIVGLHSSKSKTTLQQDPSTSGSSEKISGRLAEQGISNEMIKNWGDLNQIEPMVRASKDMLELIPIVPQQVHSVVGEEYRRLCERFKNYKFDDVVLVPHLIRGGADLAAINLIKSIAENNKVLVITTLPVTSPWLSQIDDEPNIQTIQMTGLIATVDDDLRQQLIARVLQGWKVKRLSIVNSSLGYQVVKNYKNFLHLIGCKVYLHTYAFDMTNDGYIFNMIPNGLVDAYDGVDKYITDSLTYKTQLESINGFSPKKVSELYLPVSDNIQQKKNYRLTKKILWASRVSDAKLVEVMVGIGKLLKENNVQIDVYGALDHEYSQDEHFLKMIEPVENIHYKGVYDGFSSLDVEQYDLFLLTTKNEGMPNVILEACMSNLFVIAPPVGGISETISDGVNGLLVSDKFSSESYVRSIMKFYENSILYDEKKRTTLNSRIRERHSQATYRAAVEKLMS